MNLLADILAKLGFGGEFVLALSVGFVAWYLVRGLKIGKAAGSIVDTITKMLAFAIGFLAVGIWRNWWDPSFNEMWSDAGQLLHLIINYGGELVDMILQSGVMM